MSPTLIPLHPGAPPKPCLGAPCNGCGVCCTAETCPLGRLVFLKVRGPCPALEWDPQLSRYHCGLADNPERYLAWLPCPLRGLARPIALRWIASGIGCDSDSQAV